VKISFGYRKLDLCTD